MSVFPEPYLCYLALLLVVAWQRLAEVSKAENHRQKLLDRGATEHAPEHYMVMVSLHGLFFLSCVIEASYAPQLAFALLPTLAKTPLILISAVGLLLGNSLRLYAMETLGERWTTRILVLPGQAPIHQGLYRWLRHPNYLGVALELACLPLLFGSLVTAIVFSLANGLLLLAVRIPKENQALQLATPPLTLVGGKTP